MENIRHFLKSHLRAKERRSYIYKHSSIWTLQRISREKSPLRKTSRRGPLSTRKAAIKRLIALNRPLFRLIETVGGNRRFGPDIYYRAAFWCIVVPCTVLRMRHDIGCVWRVSRWMNALARVCARARRYVPSSEAQPRRSVFPRTLYCTYESRYSFRDQETLPLRPFYTVTRITPAEAIACEPPVRALRARARDAIADTVMRSRKSEVLLASRNFVRFETRRDKWI